MKIRTAIITSATGLLLTAGTGTDASAQYRKTAPRGYDYGYYENGNGYVGARQAQRIVRRAYRDILGREVDATGLRDYTDAMVNRGWSEADVRRALLNSPERARMMGYRYRRARIR
jgi:hypothetical protein